MHDSPPSSEANLCWQNRSHITRRTEEVLARGAERLFSEHCYPRVSTTSREPPLPAFRVFPGFSGVSRSGPPSPILSLVRRDHSGSEREPRGYVRTPNISRKNSRALAIETTNGLTALSSPLLSGAEGGRESSSAPPPCPSAPFRTPTCPNRLLQGGGLPAMYTFTCRAHRRRLRLASVMRWCIEG